MIPVRHSKPAEFDREERKFQEQCHRLSFPSLPAASAALWMSAPFAMAPSIARNRKYSYVISASHPIRLAAQVPQFARREVVRRLIMVTRGHEEGGGEHPKLVLPSGKRVPVPGHRDLARGTTRKILREAGINMPLTRFMSADDRELSRAVSGRDFVSYQDIATEF